MIDETIVAVYDTVGHAEAAVSDLIAGGVPQSSITQHTNTQHTATMGSTAGGVEHAERPTGFWASLFGGEPDHDTAVYDRSVESGSAVVMVKVPDEHVTLVTDILERHHPIDIDDRAGSYGLSPMAGTPHPLAATATTGLAVTDYATPAPMAAGAAAGYAATDSGTMKLSEERLAVGKRLINRGGTRIRRFVVETPVEEQVTLHDEKVTLERRPITDGAPVAHADFSEKVIEMVETAEELVVAKTAHVVEEIGLRKESTDRVETVRETLRREDVEVEKLPGEFVTATPATSPAPSKI